MVTELFSADGRTDAPTDTDMTKLIVAFRIFFFEHFKNLSVNRVYCASLRKHPKYRMWGKIQLLNVKISVLVITAGL